LRLEVLSIERVRQAVRLDGTCNEAHVFDFELHEPQTEPARKAVYRVSLLSLDPGDRASEGELSGISRDVETYQHFVPDDGQCVGGDIDASQRKVEEHGTQRAGARVDGASPDEWNT
jgi:hypothetical protein